MNLTKGALVFYTQRVDGRPFVNCMLYAHTTILRWMGYDCPRDYGMTLRVASGVPVKEHLGTSISDTKRAMRRLLPAAPVVYAGVSDADLWAMLRPEGKRGRNRAVVRVQVRMHQLPRRLRRHVGYDWVGSHACVIAAKRICNGAAGGDHADHRGVSEVWWMDPMGRPSKGYTGEWTAYADVQPALQRNAEGSVKATFGFKNTAE